jgi:hypothetical protein
LLCSQNSYLDVEIFVAFSSSRFSQRKREREKREEKEAGREKKEELLSGNFPFSLCLSSASSLSLSSHHHRRLFLRSIFGYADQRLISAV